MEIEWILVLIIIFFGLNEEIYIYFFLNLYQFVL